MIAASSRRSRCWPCRRRDHGPDRRVNVLSAYSLWPGFRRPSMAGFGCPPRLSAIRGLPALLAVLVVVAFATTEGSAQDKFKISGKSLAANTKYTQQHIIDVGDVPGHQIRILVIHRTPTTEAAVYSGVRVVEEWARGYTDYTNGNGLATGYSVSLLENGDKIFSRWQNTTHTVVNADGSRKATFVGVTTLVGGTGKFQTIRGTQRFDGIFDAKAGLNELKYEGEYWFEK